MRGVGTPATRGHSATFWHGRPVPYRRSFFPMKLRKFQKTFLDAVESGRYRQLALSLPRGNGKSQLAGYLAARLLTPGDSMFRPGSESIVIASTLEQGRIVYRFARDLLDPIDDYRLSDSLTKVQILHKPTRTALQVRSSNAKGVLGLVNTPWVLADEPGAWATTEGGAMYGALTTSSGKPNSPLTTMFFGTISPAQSGWWPDMIANGTRGSVFVQALQGRRETWDRWPTIRKANPLMATYPESRKVLLEERDAAQEDTRLKALFLSDRLNVPTQDEASTLLTVDDWEGQLKRPTPEASGQPMVAIDLGAGRAWSAAVAIWQSGRVEALAVAPGIPDLEAQERRDHVPAQTYTKLAESGRLSVAEGLFSQPPSALWELVVEHWGLPVKIVSDRFRLKDLVDAVRGGCPLEPRVPMWAQQSEDIRALRKICRDGPLVVDKASRAIVSASLSRSKVLNDKAGNTRMEKDGSNNTARDDVAFALVLAAGAWERASRQPNGQMTHVVIQ